MTWIRWTLTWWVGRFIDDIVKFSALLNGSNHFSMITYLAICMRPRRFLRSNSTIVTRRMGLLTATSLGPTRPGQSCLSPIEQRGPTVVTTVCCNDITDFNRDSRSVGVKWCHANSCKSTVKPDVLLIGRCPPFC
ncbi:hypothetical protein Ahy_A03g011477 isoform A [Arachis hypogaea]|uniref:Uncharacterized protein n=1 Tax=Arachis hypogaea TaxID=3818 RepID=A0A445DQU6_ARAHY|nr:hypothetical protein Ahy_A03g011477 isoform A [Arachis hypogaea]